MKISVVPAELNEKTILNNLLEHYENEPNDYEPEEEDENDEPYV